MTDLRGVGFPQKIRRTEVLELLSARYPNQIWNYRLLLKGRFGQQRRLESAIASLFPVPSCWGGGRVINRSNHFILESESRAID